MNRQEAIEIAGSAIDAGQSSVDLAQQLNCEAYDVVIGEVFNLANARQTCIETSLGFGDVLLDQITWEDFEGDFKQFPIDKIRELLNPANSLTVATRPDGVILVVPYSTDSLPENHPFIEIKLQGDNFVMRGKRSGESEDVSLLTGDRLTDARALLEFVKWVSDIAEKRFGPKPTPTRIYLDPDINLVPSQSSGQSSQS